MYQKKFLIFCLALILILSFALIVYAEKVELTVWLVRDRFAVDLTEWNEQNPNIKINYEVVPWERTLDKLILAAAAKRAPDVVVIDFTWVAILGALGHIKPLDDLIEQYWTEEDLNDFLPASWGFVKYNGTIYAMPYANLGRTLLYRADWFEEAGLDPPKTWDDVIEAAKKLQDEEKGIWGLSVRGKRDDGTTQGWLPIFYAMGGEFKNEIPQIDSEAGIKALKLYQDLVWKEKIMSPDTVSFGSGEARGLFLAESAVMAIVCSHVASACVKAGIPYGNFKLAYIPVPEKDMEPRNVATSFQWAIHTQTEHTEEAIKFLKYATGTQAQYEFNKEYQQAVRKSVYELPEYRQFKPWVDFILEDMKNMRPLPSIPEYMEVSGIIQRALQEMLIGPEADPAEVARTAQQEIDKAVGLK